MHWESLILEILTVVILVVCYLKRKRMGTVILKLKGRHIWLITLLIITACLSIGDLAYSLFLPGLSLPVIVDKAKDVLFCALLFYCFIDTNKITDKGVVLSDTLREWHNIEHWLWSGKKSDILMLCVLRQGKDSLMGSINMELRVYPWKKESIDTALKRYIPEKFRSNEDAI